MGSKKNKNVIDDDLDKIYYSKEYFNLLINRKSKNKPLFVIGGRVSVSDDKDSK